MSKKNFSFVEEDDDEGEEDACSIKKKFPKFALAIANPSEHYRYAMLKQGQFSDFALKWNKKKYPVHRCVVYSESLYFQTLFSSDWKESASGQVVLPNENTSRQAFESFLLFLYTGRIRRVDLEQYIFELYDLCDYFQVKTLKELILEGIKPLLTVETAELYLLRIRTQNEPDLRTIFSTFVAENHVELHENNFPFHQVGKNMLLEIFRIMNDSQSESDDSDSSSDSSSSSDSDSDSDSGNEVNNSSELSYGDPTQHRSYAMFKEGKFTDFTLKFKGHEYPVHKCILFSDSQYFHNYLNKKRHFIEVTSNWECPQEAIVVFLLSLYTNSVAKESFWIYWWLLCYLAIKYTVEKLKKFCLPEIARLLNQNDIDPKHEIAFFRSLADSDVTAMFAKFIAENYSRLLKEEFPFHSTGKNIILQVFKKLADKKRSSQLSNNETKIVTFETDEEIEDF
jgi:hypothetical protein